MNGKRLLGHLLLWSGFLAAALASVSRKEIDLLPENERTILKNLDNELSIPKVDLLNVISKPIQAQDQQELRASIEQLNAWQSESRLTEEKLRAEEKKPPRQIHPQKKLDIISRRTSTLDDLWSTVVWRWYGLALLVGVVGVVLLRTTSVVSGQTAQQAQGQFSTLENALRELISKVGYLLDHFDGMILEEAVEYIDNQCVLHFNDFADSRNSLTQRFGLAAFADIMSEFANGERYINRAWSASADGYSDEAKASIARSLQHLNKAQSLLYQYTQGLDK